MSDFRASCDHCGDMISHSRLICSNCTVGGWSNSIDLCGNCWADDCTREDDNKNHVSTHMLIQVRRPIGRMELHGVFEYGKEVVDASTEKMSMASELPCAKCEKAITEKPYWCCLGCNGALCIS